MLTDEQIVKAVNNIFKAIQESENHMNACDGGSTLYFERILSNWAMRDDFKIKDKCQLTFDLIDFGKQLLYREGIVQGKESNKTEVVGEIMQLLKSRYR